MINYKLMININMIFMCKNKHKIHIFAYFWINLVENTYQFKEKKAKAIAIYMELFISNKAIYQLNFSVIKFKNLFTLINKIHQLLPENILLKIIKINLINNIYLFTQMLK